MDDCTVHGDSFDDHLTLMLKCCIETNLVLNFEKCYFKVEHGIVLQQRLVLGYVVSSKGFDVDKPKVDIIQSLPYLNCVKKVRSFLGHVGFIEDLSKIFLRLSLLYVLYLQKMLYFNEDCRRDFYQLKMKLTTIPIV